MPAERLGRTAEALHRAIGLALVALLVLAPLALGAVVPVAYVPLLLLAGLLGAFSWALGHWERAHGQQVARVPLRGALLAFHALVACQLVPLPPALLRRVSPGSFDFYAQPLLVPLESWRPISVSPGDTLRGLLFLAGMSLLFATAWRECRKERDTRRLAGAVVAAGLLTTLVAFLQAGRGDTRIYGFIQLRWDWAMFGPYVNRNHFAGHLALALPLALALAVQALERLGAERRRTRRGLLLLLAETEGSRLVLHVALACFLAAGLVGSRSRGACAAVLVAITLLVVARREWGRPALLAGLVALVAAAWVGLGGLPQGYGFEAAQASRLLAWRDFLRLVPHFPVFGVGFNAFASAYPRYQSVDHADWWGEAHNEYLQVLLDTGLLGLGLFVFAAWRVCRTLGPLLRQDALSAGLLCALVASALHNLVDFNWQIAANAATFALLLGAALARVGRRELAPGPPAR